MLCKSSDSTHCTRWTGLSYLYPQINSFRLLSRHLWNVFLPLLCILLFSFFHQERGAACVVFLLGVGMSALPWDIPGVMTNCTCLSVFFPLSLSSSVSLFLFLQWKRQHMRKTKTGGKTHRNFSSINRKQQTSYQIFLVSVFFTFLRQHKEKTDTERQRNTPTATLFPQTGDRERHTLFYFIYRTRGNTRE